MSPETLCAPLSAPAAEPAAPPQPESAREYPRAQGRSALIRWLAEQVVDEALAEGAPIMTNASGFAP